MAAIQEASRAQAAGNTGHQNGARDPLGELLQHQPSIILDGALGTELERRNVVLNGTRLWSAQLLIDDPQLLGCIHADYYAAGADIVTTASYQASMEGFKEAGVNEEKAGELLQLAVKLVADARDAFWSTYSSNTGSNSGQAQSNKPAAEAGGMAGSTQGPGHAQTAGQGCKPRQRPLVGFSCGSYGACLCDGSEFTGTYAQRMSMEQLKDYHRQRLLPVAGDPRIDLLCFETVPCLLEVQAITQLLREEPPLAGMPAWVSVSCKDGRHTCHGEDFAEQVVPLLWGCEAVKGIGVNCTAPQHISSLLSGAALKLQQLAQAQQAAGLATETGTHAGATGGGVAAAAAAGQGAPPARSSPAPILLCYPNSGEGWDGEGRCWTEAPDRVSEPEHFAAHAREWVAAGARAVGGCCRTTPQHVAALRAALLGPGS